MGPILKLRESYKVRGINKHSIVTLFMFLKLYINYHIFKKGFSGSRVGGYPYAGESGNKYYKYFPREERREEREGRGEDQARREARRGERDEKRESRVREREERKAGREHDKEKKARFDSPIIVEELPTGGILKQTT